MREIKTSPSIGRQHGAVLIVALMMLLLLTMIGVAGLRDTQLQEKMAGGVEDRAIAFQAAESALRAGEAELGAGGVYSGGCVVSTAAGTSCFIDYTGLAMPALICTNTTNAACSETDYWAQYTWTGALAKTYAAAGLTEVATQPRYVIEKLPQNYSAIAGTTNASNSGGQTITDFIITARGTGRTNNAVVILQSMYRTN